GGIIAIADISGKALDSGFYAVMYLMALLSIIVGVMNLLPIPVLDGGQIFIYTIEAIIRRDISDNIKAVIFSIGWIMILALMVFATYNDVRRVFIKKETIDTTQSAHIHTIDCNHEIEKK
ncbi:MAG: site-2 protease family protein, partial [Rickettsiales bacterium]|nr:site-2 protease family protein [Rickettsiales bacterium]